jgi:hypothetical protein
VFVNYRRTDTGWAANVVTDALRRRLGPSAEVFLDNRSIGLGESFAQVLEEGVRRSAVLVVLIGPRWDEPPLTDRLADPGDWVRREILVARERGARIVPVLVDRTGPPAAHKLPPVLEFLPSLQATSLRQAHGRDVDDLAARVAGLLADQGRTDPPPSGGGEGDGAPRTRAALDPLLKFLLPPAQQWMGNRDRLLDLALAVLGPDDRLVFLAPTRIDNGPKGSATVFITSTDVVVVEVDENFLIRGEIRFPRSRVRRVEVVPTLPLFADVVVHTTAGDKVRLQGLFRDQARQLADHLRLLGAG